jgi:hypothetical protein
MFVSAADDFGFVRMLTHGGSAWRSIALMRGREHSGGRFLRARLGKAVGSVNITSSPTLFGG